MIEQLINQKLLLSLQTSYYYFRRPIPFSDRESESYLTPLPPKEKNSKAPGQIFLMKYRQISSNVVKYCFGNASPSALILANVTQTGQEFAPRLGESTILAQFA